MEHWMCLIKIVIKLLRALRELKKNIKIRNNLMSGTNNQEVHIHFTI